MCINNIFIVLIPYKVFFFLSALFSLTHYSSLVPSFIYFIVCFIPSVVFSQLLMTSKTSRDITCVSWSASSKRKRETTWISTCAGVPSLKNDACVELWSLGKVKIYVDQIKTQQSYRWLSLDNLVFVSPVFNFSLMII